MINVASKVLRPRGPLLWFLSFLLLSLSPNILSAQSRLDVPTANLEIEDAVPFPLIRKIALMKSVEKWGHGALSDPIPLSDLDGNIKAYMFSFHIGMDRFPSYEEILPRIKDGRKLLDYLKHSKVEKAKEMYKTMKQANGDNEKASSSIDIESLSNSQIGHIEEKRPDGSTPRRLEVGRIRQIEKFAMRKRIGANEFGTIVVSARYRMVPLPAYMHYLAPYFFNFDLALEKANQLIGQGAYLQRIYFLGLSGQYFEFTNDTNGILINAKSIEIKDLSEIQKFRSSRSQITVNQGQKEKIKDEIDEEWQKIMYEVGEN